MAFNSFQVPYDLRVLVERSVKEARAAYGQLMGSVTQAVAAWMTAVPQNEFSIRVTATTTGPSDWETRALRQPSPW